ncbi:MAG: cardiolipin synthase [Bacteroidetes bacterium HGW-Bacteroidetes-21]|nr:MAG: cardiolipin synthase [Bacteroidetes bacterium HGW-Bacteroidetes-21]
MWQYIFITLEVINILAIIFVAVNIFFEKRPASQIFTWILIFILIPFFGFVLFILLGRNFRKQRIFTKKEIADSTNIEKLSRIQSDSLEKIIAENEPELRSAAGLIKLLLNNNKAILSSHNEVNILNNGEETFPAIYQSLENAKSHIHLEYYMFNEGKVGDVIADILIRKAQAGVKVRLIYDDFGSWGIRNKFLKKLKNNGIECHAFIPVRFPLLATKVNYRNHRKIIVVDGLTGFIGGLNIDDRYLYGDPELGFWRDTHMKITGSAVLALQSIFLTDWHFVTGELQTDKSFFPKCKNINKCFVQIISSGPDNDWESIMQAFFYLISTAKKYIYISTPYFFPNESILTAMITASLSGTDVRLILPSKSDSKLATWGSRSYFEELLEANVGIYLYNNGFTHSKIMVVDDIIGSVGTANMDIRSFNQNFESTALIYDMDIARQLKNEFIKDLEFCSKLNYSDFRKRLTLEKAYESIARLFSPLM